MDAIIGEQSVRSFSDILAAFDGTMVQWLFTLLVLDFVTGVALALKKNEFDWSRSFDIAKKNFWILIGWGGAFVLGENAGNAAYSLALGYLGGSAVGNIGALLGAELPGVAGQLVKKGSGGG